MKNQKKRQVKSMNVTMTESVYIQTKENYNDRYKEGESDIYQIQKVNGNMVLAFNLCHHVFASSNEKKHT